MDKNSFELRTCTVANTDLDPGIFSTAMARTNGREVRDDGGEVPIVGYPKKSYLNEKFVSECCAGSCDDIDHETGEHVYFEIDEITTEHKSKHNGK